MPALFSRSKTWADFEVVTASDLNAEFDNILNNLVPAQIDDYSTNLTEMRVQIDPQNGAVLPTSLAEEIAMLRNQIAALAGNTYWYEDPKVSLAGSAPEVGWYFDFEGTFNELWNMGAHPLASRSGVGDNIATLGSLILDTTQKKFGNQSFKSYEFAPGLDGHTLAISTTRVGDVASINGHFRNAYIGESIAYNPMFGEIRISQSGKLEVEIYKDSASQAGSKDSVVLTGNTTIHEDTDWHHFSLTYNINGIEGAGTDAFSVLLDGEEDGLSVASQTHNLTQNQENYWFVGNSKNDPSWDDFTSMNGLPDATNGWSVDGDITGATVANGILTIDSNAAANDRCAFTKTVQPDFSTGFTAEWKMQIDSLSTLSWGSVTADQDSPLRIRFHDGTNQKEINIVYHKYGLVIYNNASRYIKVPLSTQLLHVYRIVVDGSNCTLYVDGVRVAIIDTGTTVASSNLISFGDDSQTDSSHQVKVYFHYFAYKLSGVTVPNIKNNANSNYDDFILFRGKPDLVLKKGLSSTAAKDLIGNVAQTNRMPKNIYNSQVQTYGGNIQSNSSQTLTSASEKVYFWSDGFSQTEIDLSVDMHAQQAGVTGYVSMEVQTLYNTNGAAMRILGNPTIKSTWDTSSNPDQENLKFLGVLPAGIYEGSVAIAGNGTLWVGYDEETIDWKIKTLY